MYSPSFEFFDLSSSRSLARRLLGDGQPPNSRSGEPLRSNAGKPVERSAIRRPLRLNA
jgi:hypothetical protein